MENVNIRQLPCNDPSVPCNDYGLGVCNYTTAVCDRVVPSLSSAPADQRPNWTACNVVPAPAPALPPRRALGSRPHAFKPDDDQSQTDGGRDTPRRWWPKPPAIHFTPVGMTVREPPHDIAAVLWEEASSTWWVWIYGCGVAEEEQQAETFGRGRHVGWQLISSTDLVNWRLHDDPTPVGGTGSAMIDPRTNETLL